MCFFWIRIFGFKVWYCMNTDTGLLTSDVYQHGSFNKIWGKVKEKYNHSVIICCHIISPQIFVLGFYLTTDFGSTLSCHCNSFSTAIWGFVSTEGWWSIKYHIDYIITLHNIMLHCHIKQDAVKLKSLHHNYKVLYIK